MIIQFSLEDSEKLPAHLYTKYWLFRDEDGEAVGYGRLYENKPLFHEVNPVPEELSAKYGDYYQIELDSVSDTEMNNIVSMKLLPRLHFFFVRKAEDHAVLLNHYRFQT